jgi:hypothetical protein
MISSSRCAVAVSDDALLVAALTGDEHAWAAFEVRLRDPLLAVVRRRTPGMPADLQEEVRQEVWTAVWLRGQTLSESRYIAAEQSPLAYLSTFVPNAVRRVRAAYRPAGVASRPTARARAAARADGAEVLVPRHRWDRAPDADVTAEREAVLHWEREDAAHSARLDVTRAIAGAPEAVARGLALMLAGATFEAAAPAVGLSPTTFRRSVSGLAAVPRRAA